MFDVNFLLSEDGYDPRNDKDEYMNEKQLQYFCDVLTKWKNFLNEQLQKTTDFLQAIMIDFGGDESDLANTETEIINETKKKDRYSKLVQKIDKALVRIDNKIYGYCEESGEEIGIARLMARPIATLCMEMQVLHEEKEQNEQNIKNRLFNENEHTINQIPTNVLKSEDLEE